MPIHDWTRVEAGLFHHFHQTWIPEIARALNDGLLPDHYYAMVEQLAAGVGPDVLALQGGPPGPDDDDPGPPPQVGGGLQVAPPRVRQTVETGREFYRRKQSSVTVRHVSDDRVIAMIQVVSPGNKSGRRALRTFVDKVASLLERRIHLLTLDLFPPGRSDPAGLHAAIWEDYTGDETTSQAERPLTLVAYESAETVRAFVEPVAVGDELPEMPLFLVPGGYVSVPLGPTYGAAHDAFPRRWRGAIEA